MGYYVALYRVLELKSYSIPQRETGGRLSLWAYAAHPLVYHESFESHRGDRRGNSPFCWKSKNQEVFGVSLVTFFT